MTASSCLIQKLLDLIGVERSSCYLLAAPVKSRQRHFIWTVLGMNESAAYDDCLNVIATGFVKFPEDWSERGLWAHPGSPVMHNNWLWRLLNCLEYFSGTRRDGNKSSCLGAEGEGLGRYSWSSRTGILEDCDVWYRLRLNKLVFEEFQGCKEFSQRRYVEFNL